MSGGAPYRLSPADEVDVRGRHPGGDFGLQLDFGQCRGDKFTAVRAPRRLPGTGSLIGGLSRGERLGAVRVGEPSEVDLKRNARFLNGEPCLLSLIHISEPTRLGMISYAVFCLK